MAYLASKPLSKVSEGCIEDVWGNELDIGDYVILSIYEMMTVGSIVGKGTSKIRVFVLDARWESGEYVCNNTEIMKADLTIIPKNTLKRLDDKLNQLEYFKAEKFELI